MSVVIGMPYTMCAKMSRGIPSGKSVSMKIWVSGIITAW
jgi:hypothetical protein